MSAIPLSAGVGSAAASESTGDDLGYGGGGYGEGGFGSGGESDDGSVRVNPGHLEVEIVDATDPVRGGERLEVTARVENTGGESVTQDVRFLVGGSKQLFETQTVTLEPDEADTIRMGYDTFPVQRDVSFSVFVATDDDEAERTVEVLAADSVDAVDPGHLEVEIVDATDPVRGGERLEVTARVENTGGESVTQDVRFLVGGSREQFETQAVSLEANESRTITLGYDTFPVRRDVSFSVFVATDDDEDERTVEVFAANEVDPGHLEVEIVDTTAPVSGGERLEVTARVENTGGESVTQDVRFLVGGSKQLFETQTVTLGPDEADTIRMGYDTFPVQRDVSFSVFVATDDDEDELVVAVSAAGS